MSEKFDFSLKIKNIGPLDVNFSRKFSTNKTLIFANNGSGKTFLSKNFRLLDTQYEKRNEKHDNLLTFEQTNAEFSFFIKDNFCNILIQQGNPPKIKPCEYIFHVFNADYINDVVKSRKYSPIKKEDINGEIVIGTPSVELDEKRAKLSELEIKDQKIKNAIQGEVKNKISDYEQKYKLSKFSDFRSFKNRNMLELNENLNINIEKNIFLSEIQNITENIDKLSSFPEYIEDVPQINIQSDILNISEDLKILKQICIPLILEEDFKKYIDNNQSFIECGNKLLESTNVCPYCKQNLDDTAKKIIEKYNKYLSSEENYCKNFCKQKKDLLEKSLEDYENKKEECIKIIKSFNELKIYFPDNKDILNNIDIEIDHLKKIINKFISKFMEKYQNPSLSIDISQEYSIYSEKLNSLNEKIKANNLKIEKLNKSINNIKNEIRELKQRLIVQIMDKNIFVLSDNLPDFQSNIVEIQNLKKDILEIEGKFKKLKKTEYFITLKKLFCMFFQGKFILENEESGFVVKLESHVINDKLNDVLSDGEKTIMAFCNYIAETHIIVNKKEDYDKVFYIIDDPISSLDSDYIYSVASIIRYLKQFFNNINYEKYIILTHNINFVRILVRNKIVSNKLQIKNKNLEDLDEKIFDIPYLHHLKDIYNIFNNEANISHTTANSIRQILESIHYFNSPSTPLETFINNHFPDLSIYTFINDKSHGNLFSIHSLSERELDDMIKKLINYIKKEYPGQLDYLSEITK